MIVEQESAIMQRVAQESFARLVADVQAAMTQKLDDQTRDIVESFYRYGFIDGVRHGIHICVRSISP